MSKLVIHRSIWEDNDEMRTSIEYGGDYDAQLHNNGCLVVVEYVPDMDPKTPNDKKANLVAIFNENEWDWVSVEE